MIDLSRTVIASSVSRGRDRMRTLFLIGAAALAYAGGGNTQAVSLLGGAARGSTLSWPLSLDMSATRLPAAFLDARGLMRPASEIADVIRKRVPPAVSD